MSEIKQRRIIPTTDELKSYVDNYMKNEFNNSLSSLENDTKLLKDDVSRLIKENSELNEKCILLENTLINKTDDIYGKHTIIQDSHNTLLDRFNNINNTCQSYDTFAKECEEKDYKFESMFNNIVNDIAEVKSDLVKLEILEHALNDKVDKDDYLTFKSSVGIKTTEYIDHGNEQYITSNADIYVLEKGPLTSKANVFLPTVSSSIGRNITFKLNYKPEELSNVEPGLDNNNHLLCHVIRPINGEKLEGQVNAFYTLDVINESATFHCTDRGWLLVDQTGFDIS